MAPARPSFSPAKEHSPWDAPSSRQGGSPSRGPVCRRATPHGSASANPSGPSLSSAAHLHPKQQLGVGPHRGKGTHLPPLPLQGREGLAAEQGAGLAVVGSRGGWEVAAAVRPLTGRHVPTPTPLLGKHPPGERIPHRNHKRPRFLRLLPSGYSQTPLPQPRRCAWLSASLAFLGQRKSRPGLPSLLPGKHAHFLRLTPGGQDGTAGRSCGSKVVSQVAASPAPPFPRESSRISYQRALPQQLILGLCR